MNRKRFAVGDRFGNLVILKLASSRTPGGKIRDTVRCDCGVETEATRGNLASGNSARCSRSCTTWVSPSRMPDGQAARNHRYAQYQRNAKERGIPWDLSVELFTSIASKECHYCGAAPANSAKIHRGDAWVYNGIDRVDSREGYSPDNVVACCFTCNRCKGARSLDEFITWARRVALRHSAPAETP
jgi:5-methylcytosine-specific restriction endonuclease McrA